MSRVFIDVENVDTPPKDKVLIPGIRDCVPTVVATAATAATAATVATPRGWETCQTRLSPMPLSLPPLCQEKFIIASVVALLLKVMVV
jgi:hypothetical protein